MSGLNDACIHCCALSITLTFCVNVQLIAYTTYTAVNLEQLQSFCINNLFSQYRTNLQALGPDLFFLRSVLVVGTVDQTLLGHMHAPQHSSSN